MKALIDLDSILYKAVYRIVSFRQMREAIENYGKESARQWLMEEVLTQSINRCENELLSMQNYISEVFFEEVTSYELFITTCSKSFRKELEPSYKSNRKRNNYVWMVREHYRNNGAFYSETHEADDLIARRTKELGHGNYIIFTMDKDLKQLGGHYWNYYKQRTKDMQGEYILNDFGGHEMEFKQKNVEFITDQEADLFFWNQMLTGDAGDCVKGLHRVGKVTAEKILKDCYMPCITVMREYIKRNQKSDFWTTYKLLKLE